MVRGTVEDLVAEFHRLRLRQAEIIVEIGEAQRDEEVEIVVIPPRHRIGDRVRITTTRASRPGIVVTARDRTATVTGATQTRVDVVTDNGFHTWRAPHNVTRL